MTTTRIINVATGEVIERALTPAEIAALPPLAPTPPRLPTPRQFMDRLSLARQGEITAAAMANPAAFLWLVRLLGAVEIDPANAETIAGVQAMRAAAIITEQEAAALLAPA